MSKILIIFTNIESPGKSWSVNYINKLAPHLTNRGFDVELLSIKPQSSNFPHIKGVSLNHIGHKWFNPFKQGILDKEKNETIAVKANFFDKLGMLIGIFIAIKNFNKLISENNVKLILHYNSRLTTIQRILSFMALKKGIQQLFFLESNIPGFIEFDSRGMQALSWPAHSFLHFKQLPISEEEIKDTKNYFDFISSEKESRTNHKEIETIKTKIHKQKKPVIFLAGSAIYGSGISPRYYPESYIHSPFFKDDLEVLKILLKLATKEDWYIIFKPHPNNPRINIKNHPRLFTVTDRSREVITECIILSDVVLTLVSTVSSNATLQNRPTVLLGKTGLNKMGIVYELNRKEDLLEIIKKALKAGLTKEMSRSYLEYATRIIKYLGFARDEKTKSMIGKGFEEAAEFLVTHCN